MTHQNDFNNEKYTSFLDNNQGEDQINQYDAENVISDHITLVSALSYCNNGLSIIPIRPDGSKAPAVRWQPYQDVPPTIEEVKVWFNSPYQSYGVGIVAGRASGNLEVLDFDDAQAFTAWQGLIREQHLALLERLVLIETPSGGAHVLYRCDLIEGNQKLAQRQIDASIKTLIETRGQGGYIVAPGSPVACHLSSKAYRFTQGDAAAIPRISEDDRETLLNIARSLNEYVPPERQHTGKDQTQGTGNRPGDVYNREVAWPDILEPAGWTALETRDDETYWRRPGKTVGSLSATTNYAGSDLLYVFSTNASPFEPGHAYNKFAAYTILNHQGDFSNAAKALRVQGYGTAQHDITEESEDELCDEDSQKEAYNATQAQKLVELITQAEVELFHDNDHCYITISVDDHRETWSLRSKKFRRWMERLFYEITEKPPGRH
jgi:putative DNA primase/helicase